MTPEEEKQFDELIPELGFVAKTIPIEEAVQVGWKVKDFISSLLNSRLQSIKEDVEGLRPKRQEFSTEMVPGAAYTAGYENGIINVVDRVLTILNKQD